MGPRFAVSLLAGTLALGCGRHAAPPPPQLQKITDPASPHTDSAGHTVAPYASPRMGSGGYAFAAGNASPAASLPNGMARVGPETSGTYQTLNFLHFDGYWAGDDTILAFSHLHLHGTGAEDYGLLGIMPAASFVPTQLRVEDYRARFYSADEVGTPGYYGVTLTGGLKAEMTAGLHSAHEAFTFPAGATQGSLIVDLNHRIAQAQDPSVDPTCALTLMPDGQSLQGSIQTHNGMSGGFTLYFVMKFSAPWTAAHVLEGGSLAAPGATSASGTETGVGLDFALGSGGAIQAQVGLSLVSVAGAAANLGAELTSWDFQATQAAAVVAWNQRLNAMTVYTLGDQGGDVATFYSALHHAFVMPGAYSDVDGSFTYVGQSGTATGFHFTTDLSLWDTYRTLDPLYDLIAPDVGLDIAQSLEAMAKLGANFPKWPLATDDSGSMIGSGADVVIAQAYLNGVTGFDVADAYQRLRDAALLADLPAGEGRGGRDDFSDYSVLGYAVASHGGAVSLTCELNQDDFALANLAQVLGHADDAQALLARSHGYQKLFDPTSGFLRSRDATGAIPDAGFDATNFGSDEYVEANAYQTQFCPQFDIDGLMQLWGGRSSFVAGLESLFESSQMEREAAEAVAANPPSGSEPNLLAVNLPPKYYFGGNEPDLHYAYLFAQAGRPDLTQKWVPWLRSHYFSAQANGLPGNDDGGTMSAWYVLSALGLYPVPGSDRYIVGTPAFPRVDLTVGGGTFTITASGVSAQNVYVQSAKLNGVALQSAIIHRADLKSGGSLELVMGSAPSNWARLTD